MAPVLTLLTGYLMLFQAVLSHPGHSVTQEAAERAEFMKRAPKSARSCATRLSRRGVVENAVAHRRELANQIRAKRGLTSDVSLLSRRSFAEYNSTHASDKDVSLGSNELDIFDDNSSCMLQPEVTQGPYFVGGELIRRNIVESQAGVPLYLMVQLLDTSTCEPVPAVFVDFWHANSTGVYSGVSASGNGNSDTVKSNLNATFLRGIQQTDVNGIVEVETIFPGHYTGRATHIHILAHNTNKTVIRANSTLIGSNYTAHASHVGQIFFDQSLISKVEKTEPYASNTQDTTLNSEDSILEEETENSDPFMEYVQLSDDITDGILGWITLGIDPTADSEITAAAIMYETGGVSNPDGSGIGGPGGNGTMPSGMPPVSSGSMPAMPSNTAA